MPRRRLDSKLESTGAEFLVLGKLLIEGLQANQAYTNQADYDIVVTNPAAHRACTVQVKSRWATDSNRSFPIRRFGCDFVVFVLLNRGVRYRRATDGEVVRSDPEFYVLPVDIVQQYHASGQMSVLRLRDVPNHEQYRDAWDLVSDFLAGPPAS
jgi:hypothetical protein